MKRFRWIGFAIMLLPLLAAASDDQGFLRFPDVHGNEVVFTSEGDLWVAPLAGGTARRLTIHDGEERYARFSPDGRWIAYSGQYDGNQDVYVIPAQGGEPKRLTYHPGGDGVVDWTPDGRIMYRHAGQSGLFDNNIYTVSPEGDYPRPLGLDKAAVASFAPDGDRVAYTRILRNNATWKRYKGGLSDQIWVADLNKKKYSKAPVSTYAGHNSYPMWIGERVYFLCDSTGRKNIWSMKPDGTDPRQHTFHTDWDARWPSYGGEVIVYQLAMDLWSLDLKTGENVRLDVRLPSERIYARTRLINPSDYITGYDLNPDGKWMVISARGQLFTVPTQSRETVIRRLTPDFTARAKGAFFLGDKVVALSDASGEDEFHQYDPFLKEKPKSLSRGNGIWRYAGQPSPDGKQIAFSDGDLNLWVMEAATGKTRKIASSDIWEIRQYEWSPDSRYIAYAAPVNAAIQAVHIHDLETGEDHRVTDPLYNSYFPAWDPQGKYLYFLSETHFNPLLDPSLSQFVFYQPDKLYMLLLAKDTPNPFAPDSSLLGAVKAEKKDEGEAKDKKDKKDKDDEEKKEEAVKVKIDWAGLADRQVELPLPPGYYWGLRAGENMLYYGSHDNHGMNPGGEPPKAELNLFKLDKRKQFTVSSGMDGFDLSDDGKVLVVHKDGGFLRTEAGATEEPSGEGDDDPHVKLAGWSVTLEPRQEWKQMFREAWRLQRDFFYDPAMHGLDWPQVLKTYEPLINRISTREELNDLIGEMIGELNAGHAYVAGGDLHQPKQVSVGLLGADFSRDAGSGFFRIDRIYAPDKAMQEWNSPLAAPEVHAQAGDYVVAIEGVPTSSVNDYLQLLQGKGGKDVLLTLNDRPSLEGARDVIIQALASEDELRYADWVRGRREYVEKASGGQIGYVHLSDMGAGGLSEFGRQFYPQHDKKGMVLDVRHNGGGFVAPMLLSVLDRKVWCTETARRGAPSSRPYSSFYGHYAIICDHETGSDGETFTQGAKMLGLGTVFGTRTWGGWVGIRGDKPLNDKVWLTSPEFSGWGVLGDEKGRWLIEGHGVDPDVVVENDPASVLAGKDPQLDAALAHLQHKIKTEPMVLPERPPIPVKEVNFPRGTVATP